MRHDEIPAALASWDAGLGGLDWLNALVKEGRAVSLGGDGYPMRYRARAGAVKAVLASGPPPHNGPPVIGDDYVIPPGWTGQVQIDRAALNDCDADDELYIDAWDLS